MTAGPQAGDRRTQRRPGAGPRRVQHDHVDGRVQLGQHVLHLADPHRWPAGGRPDSARPIRSPVHRTRRRSPNRPGRPPGRAPRRTGRPRRRDPSRCCPVSSNPSSACCTASASTSAACTCGCQNPSAATEKSRPSARSVISSGPDRPAARQPDPGGGGGAVGGAAQRHLRQRAGRCGSSRGRRPGGDRHRGCAGPAAVREHRPGRRPRRPARSARAPRSGTALRWLTPSTRCDRTPRGPIRPSGSSAQRTRLRQPKPSPGSGSTSTCRSMPASRQQLFGDHGGLQLALQAAVGVLEVAPAAAARVEMRARRLDPAGVGADDRDHLAAAERTLLRLGDPDDAPAPPATPAGRRPPGRRTGPRSARRARPARCRPRSRPRRQVVGGRDTRPACRRSFGPLLIPRRASRGPVRVLGSALPADQRPRHPAADRRWCARPAAGSARPAPPTTTAARAPR